MIKNKRFIIGIVSLLLAAIVATVAIVTQKVTLGNKIQVVVFASDIKAGSKITENDVQLIEMGTQGVPNTTYNDLQSVVGRYVKLECKAGDYVLNNKLSVRPVVGDTLIANLPMDKIAIAIPLTGTNGFNNKLIAGDIIKIYKVNEESAEDIQELQFVKVLSTTVGNPLSKTTEDGTITSDASVIYNSIIVETSETQASKLVNLQNDKLYVAYICHGSDEQSETYLQKQEEINNT